MADIKVNEIPLIQGIKDQQDEPECIAYAITLLMEIVHRLECILNKEYLGFFNSTFSPMPLVKLYKDECPGMCKGAPPYFHVGLHKFLYMAQHIRDQGLGFSFGTGRRYKIESMSVINIEDYEWMCEELADGNPLLVNFIPGQKFGGLEYCRMYKSIGPSKIASDPNREYIGHMAVLVGAKSHGVERGFWVVNSHSELWCPKFSVRSIPRSPWSVPDISNFLRSGASRGGIFKLNSENIVWNAIKFARREDDSAPFGSVITNENLYTVAAPGSGESDKATVSNFLYNLIVGSHFNRRLIAEEKVENTLGMFSDLPFNGYTSVPPPPDFLHIESKRILEAFQSLPFSSDPTSP